MSRENVDLIYRGFEAFNRRDLDAFLALMDPKVEFTPYEVWVHGGSPYCGHDGVRSWWEDSFAVFPGLRAEVYEARDLGDMLFVHGCIRGQGAASGASFERTLWQALEFHKGKIVWWAAFGSEVEALDAVGLRE